jgi:general secretion pathway protein G
MTMTMRKRMTMARTGRGGGFTLIELLLVLVILAVLAAVVVPKFTNRGDDARIAAAKTGIKSLETALDMYETDNGTYPATEEGLAALLTPPASATNWKGPYIKGGLPKDPWGRDYVYRNPGTNNPSGVDLFSLGKDGNEGPDDVGNWTAQQK